MVSEIVGENRLVDEAEIVADLLDGEVATTAQHRLCLRDNIARNPLDGSDARLIPNDGAEILGRQTEQVGVETHLAAFAEIFYKRVVETRH